MSSYRIAIFTNTKYLDICKKRIQEFNNIGIDNYHFYCLDKNIFEKLETDKKELFLFDFINFRSALWYNRTLKVNNILTKEHIDVLQADADCVWYKNPTHIFNDNKDIDIFLTCGLNFPSKAFKTWGFVVRGGFYYIRNNEKTKIFMNDWIYYIQKYKDDQIALNNLLLDNNIVWNFQNPEDIVLLPYHRNTSEYFKFSRKAIVANYKDCNIMVLSAYDFPRLKTKEIPFVLDLHAKHHLLGELY
jgi:hypothetical protein